MLFAPKSEKGQGLLEALFWIAFITVLIYFVIKWLWPEG
jgi:hypothetical protein